ncbi:WhiB family transcriptional regulator [Modestobacter sp. I12A-02628]|uniref:Transcriptional regulator WhiB n=1 Tax=Goekera deserti TaxID=2497753 RepID=A0A7K3W9Y0_9ACTN|nr:WhiB family transcriptional regulator [Goekera deserti]NDI47440.1 WhiB family transcriptional regulator [Goekera deserti]NEL53251.1 WhiB family transcriptional regulator [Goekera deserti]
MADVTWLSDYRTAHTAQYDVLGLGEGPSVAFDAGLTENLFGALDAETSSWHEKALCAETDPEAFFPEKGGSTREAKKICTGCEVRAECLEFAIANDERFGIWGGLSERERRALRRRTA